MSKLGSLLAGVFLAVTLLFVSTQGIFGESFIVIILGLPWSLVPAYFEFGGANGTFVYILALTPIFINASILYGIGHAIGRVYERSIAR